MAFIEVRNVTKTYKTGEIEIKAVDEIGFGIDKGEFVVIVGPSGAGKTTILNILGGMDTATSGSIYVDNIDITKYNETQLTAYRRDDVGFVFQFYNLVGNLTALENVELSTQLAKNPLDAADILKEVGLSNRLDNFPAQLSGGEQQRVSVARALAKRPEILFLDEPTGALDEETGRQVLDYISKLHRELGFTVIMITHNQNIAEMAKTVIKMNSGRIAEVYENPQQKTAYEIGW
ncbi:MAG TPA: macrolide ABC transporter ATP-binding protein [Ruminococcaceae bacterium]|nr:macrolide ABC transporter ATP-binding protein [Oscillospiraceae bacterium]